ncbi:hypothetical protein LUZ60_016701 [Juncus effusus]|nr:hypothetical protein LUZ60_016701 [Juncus effusus]
MQFMASWSPMRRWHSEDYLPMSYTAPFSEATNQPCLSSDVSSVSTSDLSSKNQLVWNQFQLNSDTIRSFQQADGTNSTEEKFLELLSTRDLTYEMLGDYSKKINGTNLGPAKSINSYNNTLHGPERLSTQSNFQPSMSHYSTLPDISHGKLDQYPYNCNQELFGNFNVHSVIELNTNKLCNEVMDIPWSCTKNLAELISFNSGFNSSRVELNASKTKRSSSQSSGISGDSKKRKTEENSGTNSKKSKQQSTTPPKAQVSTVKLGEKISALQQLVAPFGKTDRASVLFDTFKYIEYLHEQVQLLSDPYIKSSASKDPNAIWGSLDRKEKADEEIDLQSRGLCLIPVSCTPSVCQDNADYWAPSYRSSLFR